MHYNVEHSVINYDNQSKDLAITKYNLDDREELAQRTYKSAVALRRMLEDKWTSAPRLYAITRSCSKNLKSYGTEPEYPGAGNLFNRY